MNSFFDSQLCNSGQACRRCRLARDYRRGVVAAFDEPRDEDFECPKGKTKDDFPQEMELNIFDMGVGFLKSMSQEVKARMSGDGVNVSEEERQRRMSICNDCEFFKNGRRCTKCGCLMGFKTRLRTGACPIGKW